MVDIPDAFAGSEEGHERGIARYDKAQRVVLAAIAPTRKPIGGEGGGEECAGIARTVVAGSRDFAHQGIVGRGGDTIGVRPQWRG